MLKYTHSSTILPFTTRSIAIPEKRTDFPVGGMPCRRPVCVAVIVHMSIMLSPDTSTEWNVILKSGNPEIRNDSLGKRLSVSRGRRCPPERCSRGQRPPHR